MPTESTTKVTTFTPEEFRAAVAKALFPGKDVTIDFRIVQMNREGDWFAALPTVPTVTGVVVTEMVET